MSIKLEEYNLNFFWSFFCHLFKVFKSILFIQSKLLEEFDNVKTNELQYDTNVFEPELRFLHSSYLLF